LTALSDTLGDAAPRRRLFQALKYLVYAALFGNIFFFLREELGSLEHTFSGVLSPGELVQVFAATLDTAAWVVLLLLFELETWVLDDEQITGWTKRTIHGVRLLCGMAILWAFFGYCAELITLYQTTWLDDFLGCEVAAGEWSLLIRLDEYAPLTPANCAGVAEGAYRIGDFSIVADGDTLRKTRYLAWTDVINAAAWILVVIVLEVEVRLQLRGRLTDAVVDATRYLKYLLYSTLFIAAVYWGFEGKFLDFWDASLWLFAFVFIELNVFDWQRESKLPGTGAAEAAERAEEAAPV
jgi:hypothetical protein